MAGLKALIAAFEKMPQLSELKCAAPVRIMKSVVMPAFRSSCDRAYCHTLRSLFPPRSLCSLDNNELCGVTGWGGTYTAEGIIALAKGLKQSGVTALRCARFPERV
eukprot:3339567-Prymnesium_polylepis.1